ANTTAGDTLTVTISAQDPFGNSDPSYTGTVHFTSSDPQADLPSDYSFSIVDGGTHSFAVTLKTAGPQTLRVTDSGNNFAGQAATVSEFATSVTAPGVGTFGVATGPDRSVWFTEDEPNKIGRITPAGTLVEYSIPTADSGPAYLTNGPDGNLWFSEDFANQV